MILQLARNFSSQRGCLDQKYQMVMTKVMFLQTNFFLQHCLAGWQCACPSYIPGHMDNMDIKSSIDSIRKHSLMVCACII